MGRATRAQLAELERFGRDTRYFNDHYEELLNRYTERWVAILDEQVVGAAAEFRELLDHLKENGIPIEHAFIQYLTKDEDILILPS